MPKRPRIMEAKPLLVAAASAGVIVMLVHCEGSRTSDDDNSTSNGCPPNCLNTFAPANSGVGALGGFGGTGGVGGNGGAAGDGGSAGAGG